jgi:ParB-like chromosome segregation protein Spo0J
MAELLESKRQQMMFDGDPAQTSEDAMNKKDAAAVRNLTKEIKEWCKSLKALPLYAQVDALNAARLLMHESGPFASEPVDCVQWVKNDAVKANDYNPNSVAPPEMELLRLSISADGYTQPIVSWNREEVYEVVDGFHRHRVGKECDDVRQRVSGYLPLVVINSEREDKGDRMAATIRHNRARGKHRVDAMSEIVIDLKRRRWSDEKIGKELGMDPDEVLRLTQVSGLAELFADRDFSQAWEAERIEEELDEG